MTNPDTVLTCRNCDRDILSLKTINPNAVKKDGSPVTWRVKAICCYCGDSSFEAKLTGTFAAGGVGYENPDDPTDQIGGTEAGPSEFDGDEVVFQTRKVVSREC